MIEKLKNLPFLESFLRGERINGEGGGRPKSLVDRLRPEAAGSRLRDRLTALRSTHDFVLVVDEQGIVRWVNDRLRERFARTDMDLNGRPVKELFSGDASVPPEGSVRSKTGDELPCTHRRLALQEGSLPVRMTSHRGDPAESHQTILCLDRVGQSDGPSPIPPETTDRTPPDRTPDSSDTSLEDVPLPMLVVDLTRVRQYLVQLQESGSDTEKKGLMENDEVVKRCAESTRVVGVNQKAVKLLDATDKRAVRQNYMKTLLDTNNRELRRGFARVAMGGTSFETVTQQPTFSGQVRHVRLSARVGGKHHQDWSRVHVVIRDVTERVRKKRELRLSEARYQSLFEESPIALWVQDFSRVKKYLESLKKRAGSGLMNYLRNHPEDVRECVRRIDLIDVNQAGLDLNEFPSKQHAMEHHTEWLLSMDPEFFYPEILHVARGEKSFMYETSHETYRGNRRVVELHWSVPRDTLNDWSRVYLSEIDLTDRKKVQRKLERSERRFRATFEQAATGMAIGDTEGRILRVNQALADMIGYKRDELIGVSYREFSHPDDVGKSQRNIRRLLEGQTDNYQIEKRYIHRDGTVIWTDVSVSLVRNSEQEPDYFVAVIQNITERKRMEKRNQRLLEVFDATPDFFAAAHRDGEIFYTNRSLEDLLGEEVNNRGTTDLLDIHPECDRPLLRKEALPEAEKTGKWVGETSLLTPNDEEIPVSHVLLCHRDDDGEILSYSTLMRDVSESLRIRRELEESELRFRQIAENIQDVFWLISPDHKQLYYVSPVAEQFYGVSDDVLFQQPDRIFDRIHPDDRSRVRRIKTDPERIRFVLEYRLTGESETTWIQERGFPVRNAEGEVIRIASVAEDITRRRAVEKKLRQSEKLAAIGETAAAVMHKINNPNAFVKGNLEYIQREISRLREEEDGGVNGGLAELESAVREAHEGTVRIEQFVNDMKQYTRSGDEGEVTSFDPVQLVKKTLGRLRDRWGERVELIEDLVGADSGVTLRGNPHEFTQVLVALVENAVEACPEEEHCEVHVELSRENSELQLRVRDMGKGIDQEKQEQVFEPFYTTKTADQGIGLGLAIVRDIVDGMDGNITLRSIPGKGTTFLLRFPIDGE